jgi:hypothetical protein
MLNGRTKPAWQKVVFSADCDEYGDCPICCIDYSECPCPGPTMEEEYEYRVINGELYARERDDP